MTYSTYRMLTLDAHCQSRGYTSSFFSFHLPSAGEKLIVTKFPNIGKLGRIEGNLVIYMTKLPNRWPRFSFKKSTYQTIIKHSPREPCIFSYFLLCYSTVNRSLLKYTLPNMNLRTWLWRASTDFQFWKKEPTLCLKQLWIMMQKLYEQ